MEEVNRVKSSIGRKATQKDLELKRYNIRDSLGQNPFLPYSRRPIKWYLTNLTIRIYKMHKPLQLRLVSNK